MITGLLTPSLKVVTKSDNKVRPHWKHLGKHVLGEFYDCGRMLDDVEAIRFHMVKAAELIGAHIIESVFHAFEPYGVSGVVVISESHLAIHTWPEYRCACIDLFTCCDTLDPRLGFDYLKEVFDAESYDVTELSRGANLDPESCMPMRSVQ